MVTLSYSNARRVTGSDIIGHMNRQEREEYFTVDEIAAILRMSRMSVYRLIHTGKLEGNRFGTRRGLIRVRGSALDNYLGISAMTPETENTSDK